jgi:RimJ/RimL family protein N-acetyltransferase
MKKPAESSPTELKLFKIREDVRLAALSMDAASSMYRWVCDPEVALNIGLRSSPSLEKTRDWIDNALRSDSGITALAILWDGRHVGNVVLDKMDAFAQTARLSVYIGEPSARGAGVGLTAVFLALREAFGEKKLHKVWLTVHEENETAIRLYRRLGFKREGVLRDEFRLEERRLNVLYMGVLRDEFNEIAHRF